jgi:hypothetical protein
MKMTLREVNIYFDAFSKRIENEDYKNDLRTARICCVIANAKRDIKKRRKPFSEIDFMPKKKKEKMNNNQFVTMLKAITLVHGGDIKDG